MVTLVYRRPDWHPQTTAEWLQEQNGFMNNALCIASGKPVRTGRDVFRAIFRENRECTNHSQFSCHAPNL